MINYLIKNTINDKYLTFNGQVFSYTENVHNGYISSFTTEPEALKFVEDELINSKGQYEVVGYNYAQEIL